MRTLFLALLVAAPLAAQQASETLTIDYVEVPVTVIDRGGDPVRGLTKANFEIYDGKKRVQIASFDTIDFTSKESLKLSESNPAARRSFLLLFDLGYSSPKSLQRAQEAARSFLQKSVQSRDLVGVATVNNKSGYKLISNFTTDRETVLAAINHPISFRSPDPLQLARDVSINTLQNDADEMAEAQFGDSRGLEVYERRRAIASAEQAASDDRERGQIHKQVNWISQLAASMRNLRGRKQIIYLSEGFDAHVITGRGAKEKNQEYQDADAIINGTWYSSGGNGRILDSDRRFGSTGTLTMFQVMAQAFRGSDVMLHAIDIQGIRTQEDNVRGAAENSNSALYALARPTGGEVFQGSNDLTDNFKRLLHQQEVVYVLGFQTTISNPGKLHDLKVKLVDVPSGARAFHRLGYFEGGTNYTPVERTLNDADIIVKDIPQSDVRLSALATSFPTDGDRAQVPLIVEIDGKDLLKSAKENDLSAEVFVYAFDEEGKVHDRIYQRLALDVAQVGAKLRANGIKYVATLSLPPGKYALKTLVRMPATNQKGYVRSDIVVPNKGEVVLLPPFVVDDPQSWLLVKSDNSANYPFHVNGEPFIPSANGEMPSGSVHKLAVFVWNAQPEELKWETTPQATLLGQFKSVDATKLVLQLDDAAAAAKRFGVMVRKRGTEAPLTASIPLLHR